MGLQEKVNGDKNKQEENQEETLDSETIDNWIFGDNQNEQGGTMSLVYGEDGTGKSGIVLSAVEQIEGKVVLLDLDNSASSLLKYYDEDTKKDIIIRNPQVQKYDEENDEYVIDYDQTFKRVKGAIQRVKKKHNEEDIGLFAIDGLGTLKDYAEKHMRITENVDPDEGIPIRKWKIRNSMFDDIIEQSKSLPIHTVFIGHQDFIIKNKSTDDVSSLVMNVNKKMHNKIHTMRRSVGDITKFEGEFDKAKYNVENEGKKFTFLEINQHEDDEDEETEVNWDSKKLVLEILGGESDQ